MSLTDEIYTELMDGLEKGLDWQGFLAKYGNTKGPLYNALGKALQEIKAQVTALGEKGAKLREELDQAGPTLDSLNHQIKEAESTLTSLEDRENALNEQIETLETKLAEKSQFIKQVGELEELGFDIQRLRQLKDALTGLGAKHGLKGRETVAKFFDDLNNYGAVLEAEFQLKGLQTQIETKKLEAENWQAKEEALRRRHDNLKEVLGAVHALRTRGIKVSQVVTWHQILNRIETVEQFNQSLAQYGDVTKLLNARKEETESYESRLAQVQSQVETLEKERAKIEGAIEALKVAGIEQVKTIAQAAEKQLKAVAAREMREIETVGREARNQFSNRFTQLDELLEGISQAGQKLERLKQELQKYERVKDALESHAVASETIK